METRSVADIVGPWVDPEFESGLIERCRRHWTSPIGTLPNGMLATFLRQRIALSAIIPEARRRVDGAIDDESEIFEGELAEALGRAEARNG